MKTLKFLIALTFACVATVWTAAGETSDPMLGAHELPVDVVTATCTPLASADNPAPCHELEYISHWIGKSVRGDLFLTTNASCADVNGCRHWIVEKTAMAAATSLLAFDGPFRLHRGVNRYPVVEIYTELSSAQGAYSTFEWSATGYARTASKMVYRIDGEECGTGEECRLKAHEAMQQQQVDRAVKIWENVYGVSWI